MYSAGKSPLLMSLGALACMMKPGKGPIGCCGLNDLWFSFTKKCSHEAKMFSSEDAKDFMRLLVFCCHYRLVLRSPLPTSCASAATAAIVSVVCQANDHGFGGLRGFSALDLYEYFKQLDLFLMVKHGCHV
ncbi:hypothetical protein Tco_1191939 [Tanacetum coccineum]